MQIEQLQIILGVLALALVLLIGFTFRSRLPAPKLPRIALPEIRLPSRASKASDEPEVRLSSERLARLKLDMTEEPEDIELDEIEPQEAEAEAGSAWTSGEAPTEDFAASIEQRLEEAFNLLEAGSIDMAEYRLHLGEIEATVAQAETNSQAGVEIYDPDQLLHVREAIEWCKKWAAEYDPTPI
jgi:hypothetical protein